MARERVRFSVDVDRETDVAFRDIAKLERRSKRNMHEVLVHRVMRLWKGSPERCRELNLIVPVQE